MEKAWNYFKTDKETFETITKYESEFVVNLLKKKFGKDFDGINVKNEIKRNQIFAMSLAECYIKIDVAFANKLKKAGKIIGNYFQSRSYDLTKKIEVIYGINHDQLLKKIDSMSKQNREILYYGFGISRKKMSMEDLCNYFNENELEITRLMFQSLSQLIGSLDRAVEIKKTISVPVLLIKKFIDKGYSEKDLIYTLETYDDDIKNRLKRIYGPKYGVAKSSFVKLNQDDEKAINYVLYSDDNIENRLKKINVELVTKARNSLINKKHTNVYHYYISEGYTKEEFFDAYRNLSDQQRKLFKTGYDNSFASKMSDMSDDEALKVLEVAYSAKTGIRFNLLNKPFKVNIKLKNTPNSHKEKESCLTTTEEIKKADKKPGKQEKFNNIFDFYKDRGYTKTQIESAISKLTEEKLQEYKKWFDENGERINIKDSLNENKDISNIIYNLILSILEKDRNAIMKRRTRINNFYEHYISIGFKKEWIEFVINHLTPDKIKVYNTYFDKMGNRIIKDHFNKDYYSLLTTIKINLNKIKSDFENLEEPDNFLEIIEENRDKHKKIENIVSYYNEKSMMYNLDQVLTAVSMFHESKKELFYQYFDENGNRKKDKKMDYKFYNMVRRDIPNKIESLKLQRYENIEVPVESKDIKNDDLITKDNTVLDNINSNQLEESNEAKTFTIEEEHLNVNNNEFNEYIQVLKKMKFFTKENITFLEISDKSAFYLYLLFDLNENCTYTIEEMAEYLNIDLKNFINEIKEAIKEANDKIDIRINKVCDCIKKALD